MGKTISSCMWNVCTVTRKWSLVVRNEDVLTKSPPIAVASPSSFESFVFLTSIGSQHIKQILLVASCGTHWINMFAYILDKFERKLLSC